MKKFLVACMLALPLTAAVQQKASAWTYFNWCGSCSLTCAGGGHHLLCGLWNSENWPCCGMPDFCPPPSCYGGNGGGDCYGNYAGMSYPVNYGNYAGMSYPVNYGTYAAQPAAASPAPATAQHPAATYPTTGYLPVGYYQAPGYWYGR
jgi:hypothetical protein